MPGNIYEIRLKTKDATTNIALDCIEKHKQALVFVNSKKGAERQAENIAKTITQASKEGSEIGDQVLNVLSKPTKQCKRLADCLKRGVAFHHSGLHPRQRQLVEGAFRSGKIKVISATPTLAAGLDLPAFRVIVRDTKRYVMRYGMRPIAVLEYLQMIGRAGRPKFDSYGEGICIAKNEKNKEELYCSYLLGEPENIESKLAVEPVLQMYLLSLISSGIISTRKDITEFFNKTFWAHQYKDTNELYTKIESVLNLLIAWGFLAETTKSEFIPASELSEYEYRATRLGKRVSELYLSPQTAYWFIEGLGKAAELKELKPISFLQLVASSLEIRPFLKVKTRELDAYEERKDECQAYLLREAPAAYDLEYDEFLCCLKTAMLLEEWTNEYDEEHLTEKYSTTPGDLHTKKEVGGWLLYALTELAKIKGYTKLLSILNRLRIQIRYGIKEELIPLVRIRNIGRVRARILYRNGIKDVGDIRNTNLSRIAALIGPAAAKLKEEIGGEEVEAIKIKRGGQTSLTKKW